MDNNEYWAKVIEAVAWPSATVITVTLFSDELKGLLKKITSVVKVKGLGVEAEFDRIASEVRTATEQAVEKSIENTPVELPAMSLQAPAPVPVTETVKPGAEKEQPLVVGDPLTPYGGATTNVSVPASAPAQEDAKAEATIKDQAYYTPKEVVDMVTSIVASQQAKKDGALASSADMLRRGMQERARMLNSRVKLLDTSGLDLRPSAVVIEAWQKLKDSVDELWLLQGMPDGDDSIHWGSTVQRLAALKGISPELYPGREVVYSVSKLEELRNKVAHDPNYEPSTQAALDFSSTVYTILNVLELKKQRVRALRDGFVKGHQK